MTENEMDRAAWERFGAVDYAMLLFTLRFLSHLHALLGTNSLYTLDGDKLLEWDAIEQLRLTTPALSLLFASLLYEFVQPLRI